MHFKNTVEAMAETGHEEILSDEIVVDTLGYIPANEEIQRMIRAGKILQATQAGYEINDIKLALENDIPLSFKRYADRLEAEQILADLRMTMEQKAQKSSADVSTPPIPETIQTPAGISPEIPAG